MTHMDAVAPRNIDVQEAPAETIFTRWNIAAAAVMLLACVLYLPAMAGLAVSDDHVLLDGRAIGGGQSLWACFTHPFLFHYFRPLVSVTFFLERRLWGELPMYFHQTNILLHVLATGAVIGLLRAAFGNHRLALLGGLAFAVQPAQVGGVAWIGGRTDALATLFIAWYGWQLIRAVRATGRQRAVHLGWATLAFLAGLLSKEQLLPTLLLVPLAFFCFGEGGRRERLARGLRCSVPFLAVTLAFAAAWLAVYPEMLKPVPRDLVAQACLGGRTMAYYAFLLFAPARVWMNTFTLASLEPHAAVWTLVGTAITVGAIVAAVRVRREQPAVTWLIALLLLSIAPVSNFVPVPSMVTAPWRAGMAGVAAAGLVGWAATGLWCRPLWRALPAAFLAWCAATSWWGVHQFHDDLQAYSTFLQYDPDALQFSKNLAATQFQHSRFQEAETTISSAISRLYGSHGWNEADTAVTAFARDPAIAARLTSHLGFRLEPKAVVADLFAQLGAIRRRRSDVSGAERAYGAGVRLDPRNSMANLGLGVVSFDRGAYRDAERYLTTAVALDPAEAVGHQALAQTYAAQRRWREAVGEAATVTRMSPWYGEAYVLLAQSQLGNGDIQGALHTAAAFQAKRVVKTDEDRARMGTLLASVRPRR